MLISEVGATHGLFFNHISLMILVVVPECLFQLLRNILNDILFSLCLWWHYHRGYLPKDVLVCFIVASSCLLFKKKLSFGLWKLINDFLSCFFTLGRVLIDFVY